MPPSRVRIPPSPLRSAYGLARFTGKPRFPCALSRGSDPPGLTRFEVSDRDPCNPPSAQPAKAGLTTEGQTLGTDSPVRGRITAGWCRTMRLPAPPSYPRHPETRLRPPEAGFLLRALPVVRCGASAP